MFTVTALSCAQTAEESVPLLREAVELARTAQSWRAEGTLTEEITGTGLHSTAETKFRLAFRLPNQGRFEITEGAVPQLRVCGGTAQWTYYPQRNRYSKVASPSIVPCAYPLNEWAPLLATLHGQTLAGSDAVTVDGQTRQCQLVHGDFDATGGSTKGESRTLCIDPASKLILRYRIERVSPEGVRRIATYTFTSLERDGPLAPEVFEFHAPEGATQTGAGAGFVAPSAYLPGSGSSGGVFRVGGDVSPPVLILKKEPTYTEKARKARLQGTVILAIVVSPEGEATNIQVVRSLGKGLDEKAIEAVRAWKFRPGMKDGVPVAVTAQINVNFRLLDKPPDSIK
jgi:TonB family protein